MECSICFCEYNGAEHKPLCHSCGHSLCFTCSEDLLGSRGSFNCPVCDKLIRVDDLQNVPVNFALLSLLEKQPEETKVEALHCKYHSKKAKFFCVTCDYFFCTACFESHKTHQFDVLVVALNKKIDKLLMKVIGEKSSLDKALSEVANFINSVEEDWKLAKRSIEAKYAIVGSSAASKFTDMVLELEKIRLENSKATAERLDTFNKRCEVLNRCQIALRQLRLQELSQADLESINEIDVSLKQPNLNEGTLTLRRVAFRALEEGYGEIVTTESSYAPMHPQAAQHEEVKEIAKKAPAAKRKGVGIKRKTPYWWQEGRGGTAKPFNPGDSQALERAYQSDQAELKLRRVVINFKRMTILNEISGESRRVMREVS
mmetsp:Transcript_32566/g.56372  ORF Transcript_32566/g.56372 Transcript_32566/m.56372 type:complete len:373 (-) Transcript_32566:1004-2122(-)